MQNMRAILPSLQKAKPLKLATGATFQSVTLPKQTRDTRIVKDVPVEQIADELADWILAE
jgi:electron transfer flavoprotein beta subunit